MSVLAMLGTEAGHLGVRFGRIAVSVAGEILASREVDIVVGTHHVPIQQHIAADVAHGVAATPDVAGVGCTAMDDATVMQTALVGLQFNRNGPTGVPLCGLDLIIENGFTWFQVIVIRESLFAAGMRARDNVHAPVDGAGRVDGDPHCHDFHG